ncbi:FRG domain protein [compost metagenome]
MTSIQAPEEIEITSISKLLDDMAARFSAEELLWYRGHARSHWTLEPSLVRKGGLSAEKSLLDEFKRDAIPLLSRADLSGEPMTEWDWVFVMQHYQIPTRLMDWSESPLIALFFALDDAMVDEEQGPAALWVLKPKKMNEAARITTDYSWQVPLCDVDDVDVNKYLPSQLGRGNRELEPLAVAGTRRFDRIRAQLGVFTVVHRNPKPLELEVPQALTKYIILNENKSIIREELHRLGFHAAAMYPDLEHLGRRIAGRLS